MRDGKPNDQVAVAGLLQDLAGVPDSLSHVAHGIALETEPDAVRLAVTTSDDRKGLAEVVIDVEIGRDLERSVGDLQVLNSRNQENLDPLPEMTAANHVPLAVYGSQMVRVDRTVRKLVARGRAVIHDHP